MSESISAGTGLAYVDHQVAAFIQGPCSTELVQQMHQLVGADAQAWSAALTTARVDQWVVLERANNAWQLHRNAGLEVTSGQREYGDCTAPTLPIGEGQLTFAGGLVTVGALLIDRLGSSQVKDPTAASDSLTEPGPNDVSRYSALLSPGPVSPAPPPPSAVNLLASDTSEVDADPESQSPDPSKVEAESALAAPANAEPIDSTPTRNWLSTEDLRQEPLSVLPLVESATPAPAPASAEPSSAASPLPTSNAIIDSVPDFAQPKPTVAEAESHWPAPSAPPVVPPVAPQVAQRAPQPTHPAPPTSPEALRSPLPSHSESVPAMPAATPEVGYTMRRKVSTGGGSEESAATVRRSSLTDNSDPGVVGVLCPNRHSNPPSHESCRVCHLQIAPQEPQFVPRPKSMGQLRLPDGRTFAVDPGLVLGRSPEEYARSIGFVAVTTVDEDRYVSRNHARISVSDWRVLITDLGGGGGTRLVNPGQDPELLRADEAVELEPGGTINLADNYLITFEA